MSKKPKKKKISTVDKKLWKTFSEYIRRRDSVNGICKCITCDTTLPWKDMHAGHFISRRYKAIKYDERNVHAQCCGCNTFKNGEPEEYFIEMEKRYGRDVIDELIQKKREVCKYPYSWYEEKLEEFKEKLDLL